MVLRIDVTKAIENGEDIIVFQHQGLFRGSFGGRRYIVLPLFMGLAHLDYSQEFVNSTSFVEPPPFADSSAASINRS